MKQLTSILLSSILVLLFGLLVTNCANDEGEVVIQEKDLTVYVMKDGERVASTEYRFLTDAEIQDLVDRGWLKGDNEVGFRVHLCEWADTQISITCSLNSTKCSTAVHETSGQICLTCENETTNVVTDMGACR